MKKIQNDLAFCTASIKISCENLVKIRACTSSSSLILQPESHQEGLQIYSEFFGKLSEVINLIKYSLTQQKKVFEKIQK